VAANNRVDGEENRPETSAQRKPNVIAAWSPQWGARRVADGNEASRDHQCGPTSEDYFCPLWAPQVIIRAAKVSGHMSFRCFWYLLPASQAGTVKLDDLFVYQEHGGTLGQQANDRRR